MNGKEKPKRGGQRNPRTLREIYLPSFSLYSNLAVDTLKALVKPPKEANNNDEDYRPSKDLENLLNRVCGANDISAEIKENIAYYVDKYKSIYPLFRKIAKPMDSDVEAIGKIKLWVDLLVNIRNKYSHSKHDDLKFKGELLAELQNMYNSAIEQSHFYKNDAVPFPENYRNIYGTNEDGSYFLTYTGIAFFISLFLRTQDVQDFLGELQQNAIDRDDRGGKTLREKRKAFREKYPDKSIPFSKELQVTQKDFLYGNDVYTCYAVRGHIVPIADKETMTKIRFFDLMEYLKLCPKERIEFEWKTDAEKYGTEPAIDTSYQQVAKKENEPPQVIINNNTYRIRERNNFVTYALDYWEDAIANFIPRDLEWKWARFASGDQKQKNKRLKGYNKLSFHETIVWDKPQDEELLNQEGIECSFPYYMDNNNVFFRLKRNETYVVGMMSTKVLSDLLKVYFSSLDKTRFISQIHNKAWDYTNKYLNCTEQFKSQNPNLAVPKKYSLEEHAKIINDQQFPSGNLPLRNMGWMLQTHISNETLVSRIRNKITAGQEYYNKLSKTGTSHSKMQETVKAWFDILNYGAETNWAHAIDMNEGKPGIISQYRWITYYLSRLSQPSGPLLEEFNSYLKASNLWELLTKKEPDILSKCTLLNDFFNNAMQYRKTMLNRFAEKLDHSTFRKEDWNPTQELRWLRIKSPDKAKAYAKQSEIPTLKQKIPTTPPVLNESKGVYFAARAVSLPHNFFTKVMPPNALITNSSIKVMNDFYTFDIKRMKANHARKLYAVAQEDKILGHIGEYYADKFGINDLQTINTLDGNYQSLAIHIRKSIRQTNGTKTVEVAYVYRYLKQSRYHIAPALYDGLLAAMDTCKFIPANNTINFNSMKAKQEGGNIVFVYDENTTKPTIMDLYSSYNKWRLKFIDALLKLDKELYNRYHKELDTKDGYIPFTKYIEASKKEGFHDCVSEINTIRRHALHGTVDRDIVKREEKKDIVNIDFFGRGCELIKDLQKKLAEK